MQPLGAGTDGTVEAAWNVYFGLHVYKWSSHDGDLDKEARALLLLRGPHVVQCYGLCREKPAASLPRHPGGRRGLVMEHVPKTLLHVLADPSSIK